MITVSLVGGGVPRTVQIVVDTTPAGVPWTLTGSTGTFTWTVSGGTGVGNGQQLIRSDVRTPGNTPITYTFTAGAVVQTSAPITVPMPGDFVLQSLDGSRSLVLGLLNGSLDTEFQDRSERFDVAGRSRRVVRYDVASALEGSLRLRVPTVDTAAFLAMFAPGEPLVYRLGVPIIDMAPVAVFAWANPSSVAYWAWAFRVWVLGYEVIDDPLIGVALAGFSWDAVDVALAAYTWNDFDARMSGMTWDAFDGFDWTLA